jgi:hypothetical protein
MPEWNQYLEAYATLAAAAAGEEIAGKQEDFVSSAVVCVYSFIDAAHGGRFTGTISPLVSRHWTEAWELHLLLYNHVIRRRDSELL